jgi:hypothetical protein
VTKWSPVKTVREDDCGASAFRDPSREQFNHERNQPMKTYVMTTGALFGLLTIAHIWRMIGENRQLATDPWFVLITATTAALCLWAVRLVRVSPRT